MATALATAATSAVSISALSSMGFSTNPVAL